MRRGYDDALRNAGATACAKGCDTLPVCHHLEKIDRSNTEATRSETHIERPHFLGTRPKSQVLLPQFPRLKRRCTTMTRNNFAGLRVSRTMSAVFGVALLALSTFAIAPATAQASGSWSLDCNGSASGGVSWNWTLNGVSISGAGGSVGCSGTMSATGTSARPSDANGFVATVHASAGRDANTNTVTKTFDTASSFQVKLSTSASGWVMICPERGYCFTSHVKEDVHFSFQG